MTMLQAKSGLSLGNIKFLGSAWEISEMAGISPVIPKQYQENNF
jgi:hypothetical protein